MLYIPATLLTLRILDLRLAMLFVLLDMPFPQTSSRSLEKLWPINSLIPKQGLPQPGNPNPSLVKRIKYRPLRVFYTII